MCHTNSRGIKLENATHFIFARSKIATVILVLLSQIPTYSFAAVILDEILMYSSIGTYTRINPSDSCFTCTYIGSHQEQQLAGPYQSTINLSSGPAIFSDSSYDLGTITLSSYASYAASASTTQTPSGRLSIVSSINFKNSSNSIRHTGSDTQIVEYIRFDITNQPETVSSQITGYHFNYSAGGTGFNSPPGGAPSFEIFTGSILGSGVSRGPLLSSMTLPVGSYYARWFRQSFSGSRQGLTNLPAGTNFAWSSEESGTYELDFSNASTRPGSTPTNPILPTMNSSSPGSGRLTAVVHVGSASWYDPEIATGFDFSTNNSTRFAAITGFPAGFKDSFEVLVNGVSLGHFSPGQSLNFTDLTGAPVNRFSIRGINPGVDPDSPTSFPIALAFDKENVDFNMTATEISAVPELPAGSLLALGLLALGLRRRIGSTQYRG